MQRLRPLSRAEINLIPIETIARERACIALCRAHPQLARRGRSDRAFDDMTHAIRSAWQRGVSDSDELVGAAMATFSAGDS